MRMFFTIIAIVATLSANAGPKRFVVIDMETKIPMRNVRVHLDWREAPRTIWDGSFECDTATFERIVLSCKGYERLTMEVSEMTDTIRMLPHYIRLDEVVVVGQAPKKQQFFTPMNMTDAQLSQLSPGTGSFSLSGMIDAIFGNKAKRREEYERILENY